MSREIGVNSRTSNPEQERLFCEHCQEFFVNTCPVHGPPLFIKDCPVACGIPYRALHSLPYGLALGPSEDPDQGLGVWCTMKTIPKGAFFGPLQGDFFDNDTKGSALHSWIMRHFAVKCKSKESESNWMRYVNSARNRAEQNAVPFLYKDLVYFRVCKSIEPGSALLVWFGERDAGQSEAWESPSKTTDSEMDCAPETLTAGRQPTSYVICSHVDHNFWLFHLASQNILHPLSDILYRSTREATCNAGLASAVSETPDYQSLYAYLL